MKKNKLYLLISIITLITFFGTAALCNQAGGKEDEVQAPTLKLEISEGPTFSEEDQVCYYEVEAIVTGTPEPDIEFALDDNVSLLATEKAKVVLNDSSDTYTLEATATNSEGSTSASINLSWGCEEEVTAGEDMEESGEEADEDEETTDEESGDSEDEMQEGEVLEGDPFPPELSIFKHEGPLYSAADNVCYYIIASEMYGNPYPKLTWSKNDSSSMPAGMTQVNLREGETYTLTATATSVEGTVTRTLNLEWGCDGEEVVDGDSEDEDGLEHSIAEEEEVERIVPVINETEFRIPVVPDECGQRYVGMGLCNGCAPAAGDTENNRSLVGYMSFNISSLVDVTVNEATLELRPYKEGNTSFFGNFYLNSIYWGPKEISEAGSVLSSEGIIIGDGYPSAGSGTITCTHGDLKREIQKAINDGKPRFQIRIHFSGSYTDNDNSEDSWTYMSDNINLTVEYSEN